MANITGGDEMKILEEMNKVELLHDKPDEYVSMEQGNILNCYSGEPLSEEDINSAKCLIEEQQMDFKYDRPEKYVIAEQYYVQNVIPNSLFNSHYYVPTIQSSQENYSEIELDEFKIVNGCICKVDDQGDYTEICNFYFNFKSIVEEISLKGVSKMLCLEVFVNGNKKEGTFKIPITDNKSIINEISKRYVGAYAGKNQALHEKYIAQLFNNQENQISKERIIKFSGWYQLNNGSYIYANDLLKDCSCNKRLSKIYQQELPSILQNGFYALNLSQDICKILPVFLYAHLGYLFLLFEKAGFKPGSALYVFGATNCRKTSVMKTLFNVFMLDEQERSINFSSTKASMEIFAEKCKDDTMVIDDLSLTIGTDVKEATGKFESIIRLCGDGIVKRRANKYMDNLISFDFRCAVAMNGEDLPALSESSFLRLLIINFEKETINNDVLTYFDSNPELLRKYFTAFIMYLQSNFTAICTEIKECFPIIRDRIRDSFQYPRSVSTAATLIVIGQIINEFAEYCGRSDLRMNMESNIISAVQYSESFSVQVEPYKQYLNNLFEAINNGEFCIAESKAEYEADSNKYIGFKEEGLFYLKHAESYNAVVRQMSKSKRIFPVSKDKVHKELFQYGFLDAYKNAGKSGNGYLKKVTLGKESRVSMLCLIKDKIDQFFTEGE